MKKERHRLLIKSNLLQLISLCIFIFSFYCLPTKTIAREYTKSNPLIIEGDWEYAPYEYLNEKGEPQGFNIEILKAILEEMDIPYKIELKEWSDVLKDISNGKADLACAMQTQDQKKRYYFSKSSFAYCELGLVFRKGIEPIHSLRDLKGKKIIVKKQDVAYYILVDSGFAKNMVFVENMNDMIKQMAKGKFDMAIWGRAPLHHLIYKYGFNNIEFAGIGLPPTHYHFISKDSLLLNRVNSTFIKLKADGTLSPIYNKWFNELPSKETPVYIYYILGGLILVVIILYTFITTLRYKVKKANKAILNRDKRISLVLRAGNISVLELDTTDKTFYTIDGHAIPAKKFSYEDCKRNLHPDDFIKFDNAINRIISGEMNDFNMTIRQIAEDSHDYYYFDTVITKVISEKQDGRMVMCTVKDITSEMKRQMEEKELLGKYEVVFNSTSVGLIYCDKNGMMIDINDTACKLFQISKESDIHSKMSIKDMPFLRELVRDKDCPPFFGVIRITKEEQIKYLPNIKNPENMYLKTQVTTFYDESGDIQNIIITIINVTEMRNVSCMLTESMAHLKEESEKARQADKLKSIFLANMSHEIRTPLNAIVGFSNLIESTEDPNDISEFIKIINHNSENLLRLINDILDLSRLDANIIKITPEKTDFSLVFSQICMTLKQNTNIPGVEFITDIPYKSCETFVDYNRLTQVITNFVINAAKYTKEGYIKVGFRYQDNGLYLYCEDTGTGIPKEQCGRIFDRFVKLDEFIPGTGLGLSICKAIAEHCHGKIGVESERGKGSTFWIWVPCKAEIKK
ncbi:MAG: transporter substrate-binding domain-containing protein [Bacteroidaceae bacterium]|nr:transporter substrate-binding domain-containing protein [Bacteroidaceae bacterium]